MSVGAKLGADIVNGAFQAVGDNVKKTDWNKAAQTVAKEADKFSPVVKDAAKKAGENLGPALEQAANKYGPNIQNIVTKARTGLMNDIAAGFREARNKFFAPGGGADQTAQMIQEQFTRPGGPAEVAQVIARSLRKGVGMEGLKMFGAITAIPVAGWGAKMGIDVIADWAKSRFGGSARRELQRGFYSIIKPKDMPLLTFDRHIGHADAKGQLLSFMKRMETPHLNAALNARDPRRHMQNILFYGPPGTGKTDLAKILASQLHFLDKKNGTLFINADVEKLLQLEPGTGAKNVKNLEEYIQKSKAKRVVLFVDEIDGLIGRGAIKAGDGEMHKTTTAFLKMIDGVKPLKGKKQKEILLIGATNHPKSMDEALLNRFREIIHVGAPTRDELVEMYKLYFEQKGLKAPEDLDWNAVTKASKNFTGRTVDQAAAHLQQVLYDNDPVKAKALDKLIKKKGPEALKGSELEFSQDDLLNAIRVVDKPKYQTVA